MNAVLLLIDLQQDYLAAPGLTPNAGHIVETASELLAGSRRAGIPVVHAWTTVRREDDDRMPHWRARGLWRCVENTPGHHPPAALAPVPGEVIVHKRFFSAFDSPALDESLARIGADTVLIAGIHLHACVRATALDAYRRGLAVWIADDAVGSDDPVHAAITRRYLARRAIRFESGSGILRHLTSSAPAPATEPDGRIAVDAAVGHASSAAVDWRRQTAGERAAVLARLAARMEGQTGWAEDITRQSGKPIRFARDEVRIAVAQLRAIAARAEEAVEGAGPAAPHARRRPLGVVALVTPWNNPLFLPLGKLAPALLHGNAVVWKPALATTGLAHRVLGELAACGLPPGVAAVVEGDRETAGALMEHPGVDAATLTGGLAAGHAAQEICARRMIPLQAELGGNNAAIVWPDTDLAAAANAIANGAFAMAGQRCTANRRAIVRDDQLEPFLESLARATSTLPSGDPFDPGTIIGPMISAPASQRLTALVGRARRRGVRLIEPAGPWPADPLHHPPMIAVCPDPADELVQEEAFGPLLVVQPARDWTAAMALCNGVRQGLAAALFTTDADLQRRFLDEARAGILKLNQSTAGAQVDLPFGGWKGSGIGPAEHGESDREFFTRVQAVYP